MNKSKQSTNSLWWVHGLMILMVFLIATSFPVGVLIAGALPSEVMMFIRFAMATVMFAPFIAYQYGFRLPKPRRLLAYSFLSVPLVAFFWCMFEALKYTTAVSTGALFTTVPAMTALFTLMVNGERTGKRKGIGLVVGTIGALLIVWSGGGISQSGINYGDGVFFLGSVALSLYNALVKRVFAGEPMEVMTFWVILFGTFWLALLSLTSFDQVAWGSISFKVYFGLLYLALFTTLLSFFIQQLGTVKIGATKASAYSLLNPGFVIGLSMILGLAEYSPGFVPGIILIVLAMLFIQRDSVAGRID